jgi:hypothetical protein
VIHTNLEHEFFSENPRWKRLVKRMGNRLRLHSAQKPTHVFGQLISNVYHANDVYKINYALKHGGIFLDQVISTAILQLAMSFIFFRRTPSW